MAKKQPKNPEKLRAMLRNRSGWTAEQSRDIKKKNKRKGRPAGSRFLADQVAENTGAKVKKDPRIGSKKPIALTPQAQVEQQQEVELGTMQPKIRLAKSEQAKPAVKALSVTQMRIELERLESDPRLEQLLDMLDDGKTLSDNDQAWLDLQLARHQQLMDALGLDDQEDA